MQRSLWDTIKKKKVSAASSRRKRIPDIQNVNQTFSVPPKADRVRSPLQACENLGGNEGCSPTENNSLILQENKIPISPISPTFDECHGDTCLPLCVRRSTAYTSLHSPESRQLWTLAGAHRRQEFSEQVMPETSFDSLTGVSGHIEEDGKRVLTPNCSSTLNVTQSHGDFLSPDSFVKSSHRAGNKLEPVTCVSPDMFLKGDSRPRHLESNTIHEIYQTILSPDSFLKDNYGLSQKLESESVNPFVSPNQFVKDNMPYLSVSQQTCQLSPLSKENAQAPPSPPGQRKKEVLPFIPGSQGSNSPEAVFEEPTALDMIPDGSSFTKQKQPQLPAARDPAGQGPSAQPQRRPILSATVTKPKPAGPREHSSEASGPKARRCLRSAVGGCGHLAGDPGEEDAFHSHLPVIEPAGGSSNGSKTAPSSKTAFAARKRKSGGSGEDAHGAIAGTGPTEERESKRIHFSPAEPRTSTAKKTKMPVTPAAQGGGSRRRSQPKKKAGELSIKACFPLTASLSAAFGFTLWLLLSLVNPHLQSPSAQREVGPCAGRGPALLKASRSPVPSLRLLMFLETRRQHPPALQPLQSFHPPPPPPQPPLPPASPFFLLSVDAITHHTHVFPSLCLSRNPHPSPALPPRCLNPAGGSLSA